MAGSGNLWAGPVVINITNKLFIVQLFFEKNVSYLYVALKQDKLRAFYPICGGFTLFPPNKSVDSLNRQGRQGIYGNTKLCRL